MFFKTSSKILDEGGFVWREIYHDRVLFCGGFVLDSDMEWEVGSRVKRLV